MILDEAVKKSIGVETGKWFYSNNIRSTYEELKGKAVDITVLHLKSINGGYYVQGERSRW